MLFRNQITRKKLWIFHIIFLTNKGDPMNQYWRYDTFYCRMCEGFLLCPTCFDSPSALQLHNAHHIFIKLRSKPKRSLPPGALLKPKVSIPTIRKLMGYIKLENGTPFTPNRCQAVCSYGGRWSWQPASQPASTDIQAVETTKPTLLPTIWHSIGLGFKTW